MGKRKPPPAFEVLFEGSGILPEKIPLSTLSRALSAVQRMAAGENPQLGEDEEDDVLSLLGVKRGSARFECAATMPDRAIANLRLVGAVLDAPDQADAIAYAFSPIEDLSAIAKSLGCTITLRRAGERSAVLAKIEPDTFGKVARSLLLEGDTTITGRVVRAGGSTDMRAALRIPSQARLLYCKVKTPEAVRKLGERLYEYVVVAGKARWIRASWRVVSFEIHDVFQPQTGSLKDAFAAIRDAGGKEWDRIADPRRFLREVTGD
jgi:hypothetical protein